MWNATLHFHISEIGLVKATFCKCMKYRLNTGYISFQKGSIELCAFGLLNIPSVMVVIIINGSNGYVPALTDCANHLVYIPLSFWFIFVLYSTIFIPTL